jgi:hypothetical protein
MINTVFVMTQKKELSWTVQCEKSSVIEDHENSTRRPCYVNATLADTIEPVINSMNCLFKE